MAPVSSVSDLGIHLDADLAMRTDVAKTIASCFAVLRYRSEAFVGQFVRRCFDLSSLL